MKRMVDLKCPGCERELHDQLLREEDIILCLHCAIPMEQIWWLRPRLRVAQWSDKDAVVVHIDPMTGDVRYPAHTEQKVKQGYEKVYLRSLQEVNKFELAHNVMNHVMHYDRNGRDHADQIAGDHH